MDNYVIFADSTCDLGKDVREKYGIEYVAMNYVIGETEYRASLDWENHSAKEFYDIMRNGTRIRTTQVAADSYRKDFGKFLEQGMDIVYVACSSAMSGSVNVAKVVADELKKQYPERNIYCIDSLTSSLGQGSLAIRAAQLKSEGKSAAETAKYIIDNRLKYNQFATVGTLSYLKRAGRVTASSAFFGDLFGVRPILISDTLGQNYAIKKVKGSLNAKREIAALLEAAVENPEEQTLFISHSDVLNEAEQLRDEILKCVKFKDCYINYITTITGASVGPGAIIANCVGKEVTIEGRD